MFILKKFSLFANLQMEKPQIHLLHLDFHKQPVYKKLALAWQLAIQLSGLKSLSLSNNKNYSFKKIIVCIGISVWGINPFLPSKRPPLSVS